MSTVRLAALAAITGRPLETIKNLTKAREVPWDEATFPQGRHHRYSGQHATQLVLAEMFHSTGLSLPLSAEVVRKHEAIVGGFFDALGDGLGEPDGNLPEALVADVRRIEFDSFTGLRPLGLALMDGTREELLALVESEVARLGTSRPRDPLPDGTARTVRMIGGPIVRVFSVGEAYRIVRLRAQAVGYLVAGRRILPLEGQATEGAKN